MYLDHAVLMHGDAVVGVFGELEECLGGGLVHTGVSAPQVAHQGGHGPRLPKRHAVAAPHAAAGDGLRQVTPQFIIRLSHTQTHTHTDTNSITYITQLLITQKGSGCVVAHADCFNHIMSRVPTGRLI